MKYNIAVIPGDGIGIEVMDEALKVLNALNKLTETEWDYTIIDWSSEYYLKHQKMMPDNGLEILKEYDAILFGAIGDARVPDDVTVWELIMPIRKQFQQYVNLRPVKLLKGLKSPMALETSEEIDFVVIRENTEGEYSDVGGSMFLNESREMSVQNTIMTRQGVNQIANYAFDYARKNNFNKVTSATKSNAIVHVMKFWDKIVHEVVAENPEIEFEQYYIDALAAYFVERPESFEVVLSSNLFGDILSDLGSAIVGGLGVSPSGNINPEGDFPSMFEPVHGSAPDIAGQEKANPIAQIWSVALMMNHFGLKDEHNLILKAIENVIAENKTLTPDLGGTATTSEVGDAIVEQIYKNGVQV